MAKLFGLTAEQQKRLARVADKVEGQPIQRANQKSGTSKPSPSFWVELTEEDPDNPGRYAWKMVDYVDHEWTDRDPPIESPEGEYTAIEANLGSGMVGQRVELHFYGYDAEGKPRYLFGRAAIPFLARVVNQGPNGEPDYAPNSYKYWVIPVRIVQRDPDGAPETSDDVPTRFEDTGEALTVINAAERAMARIGAGGSVAQIGSTPHLTRTVRNGDIVRVWTELDDQNVPRYFMNETRAVALFVQIITRDVGGTDLDQAGVYTGRVRMPLRSTGNTDAFNGSGGLPYLLDSHVASIDGTCVVINVAELGNTWGSNPWRALRQGDYYLGQVWGWTAEDPPRRLVLVEGRACEDLEMQTTGIAPPTYNTDAQLMLNNLKADIAALHQALRRAGLMQG